MKVGLNPAASDELIRRAEEHKRLTSPRQPGLHVSDIVRCRRQYFLKQTLMGGRDETFDLDTLVMFWMGTGHHAVIQQDIAEEELVWSFGGITVTGNVDMQEWDVDGPVEAKTTRASAKKRISDLQHYIEQVCSYCIMKGRMQGRRIRSARIHAFHLLGDYTGPKKSKLHTWDIEFTDAELDAWEAEMTRRAALLASGSDPGLEEHREWECQYCPFLDNGCPGGRGNNTVFFQDEGLLQEYERVLVV